MQLIDTAIPDVRLLTPRKFEDNRGFFFESYNKGVMSELGFSDIFIQDNHSFSKNCGTVRGLHYQLAPQAQAKLVRVIRGAVVDVAVDIRPDSPSYGQYVCETLSAENMNQLYIPAGFAHGFCTLEDDTEVLYKVTALYSPQYERGILWNDPDIGIEWPFADHQITLSTRDTQFPGLKDQTDF